MCWRLGVCTGLLRGCDEAWRGTWSVEDKTLRGMWTKRCVQQYDVSNRGAVRMGSPALCTSNTAPQIEALRPRPAAVVFLGDVIHNGYYSHDFDWCVARWCNPFTSYGGSSPAERATCDVAAARSSHPVPLAVQCWHRLQPFVRAVCNPVPLAAARAATTPARFWRGVNPRHVAVLRPRLLLLPLLLLSTPQVREQS